MLSDIPADVAYIGGVWCEAVLYGIHLVAFGVVCSIFLGKSYMRGRDIASGLLLGMSTCMFVLSTVHVALALHHLVRGFILERGIEGGPDGFFHRNVFPARKAIYVVNTLLGDSLLIWRVYVIWGRSWKISTLPVPPVGDIHNPPTSRAKRDKSKSVKCKHERDDNEHYTLSRQS